MDKYEYRLKTEHIKRLAARKEYASAVKICDGIDWNKVKDVKMLTTVSDIYEAVGRYQEAIDVLIQAYQYAPIGRRIVYRLTELAVDCGNYQDAEEYYEEFCNIAPNDMGKIILKYRLEKAKGAKVEELIKILEKYKEEDFDERWSYELAELYAKAGRKQDCVSLCDDIILWFGLGKYVDKALYLKAKFAPLSDVQKQKLKNGQNFYEGDSNVTFVQLPDEEQEHFQAELAESVVSITEGEEKEEQESPVSIRVEEVHNEETEDQPEYFEPEMEIMEEESAGDAEDTDKEETESPAVAQEGTEPETAPVIEKEEEPEAAPEVREEEEPEAAPAAQEGTEPETAPVIEKEEEPETAPVIREEESETVPAIQEEEEPEAAPAIQEEEEPEVTPAIQEEEEPEVMPAVQEETAPEDAADDESVSPAEKTEGQDISEGTPAMEAPVIKEEEEIAASGEETQKPETESAQEVSAAEETEEKEESGQLKFTEPGSFSVEQQIQELNRIIEKKENIGDQAGEVKTAEPEMQPEKQSEAPMVSVAVDPEDESRVWHFFVKSDDPDAGFRFAVDKLRAMKNDGKNRPSTIARTKGSKLNGRSIIKTLDKLLGKAVIVEQAGGLDKPVLDEFSMVLDKNDRSLIVVFIDTEKEIDRIIRENPKLADVFSAQFHAKKYTVEELMEYAKGYADRQDCAIDESARLLVTTRLEKILKDNPVGWQNQVERVMDEAMEKANKKSVGKAFKGLFVIRYDDEGRLLLKEEDFK
ncbi:MAG TPA: hypothetical protein IAB48_02885 [Candidatus Fimimorpha excrementavium]|nr:hypothetical protein [Candidatus Fimimorpha excrementavium]